MAPTIGRVALDNGFHGSIPGDWVAPPPQNIQLYRGIFKTLKNEVRLRSISIDIFIVMDKEKREVGAPL